MLLTRVRDQKHFCNLWSGSWSAWADDTAVCGHPLPPSANNWTGPAVCS